MGTEREGAPGGRMGMKGGMGMQRQEAPGGRDGSERCTRREGRL